MTNTGGHEREKADSAERLLNLTLALISSQYGMTKAELFRAIREYRNDLEDGKALSAVEKKFERDKDELRSSGIQLETVILKSDGDDNQESRYLINPTGFQWPKGAELNPKQLQILQLAASVWRQASLSSDAAKGLDRLRSLGAMPASSDLVGFAPRIRTHDMAFAPLTEAITERRVVTFGYRKAGEDAVSKRRFAPWRIAHIENQWLVQGLDLEKNEYRNFMLKRIVSSVDKTVDTFEAPLPEQLEELQASLDKFIANNLAVIAIKRDSMAWYHFDMPNAGSSEFEECEIHYMDLWLLAEELRDYAGQFKVVKPEELSKAIRFGYEKVAAEHG